jgi:hypothetical protein
MLLKSIFITWLLAITLSSLVDYSSVSSGLGLLKSFGTGFWLHIVGYFMAGLLFVLAFGKKGHGRLLIALVFLFVLGVLFEIAQLHLPKRTFNPLDIAANGLGLAGFYVFYSITRTSRN